MSKNKHTNPAYISHVHLKGYKSIIDTEVELHPGLNIIIGPNGSGKTNFLEFLGRLTSFWGKAFTDEIDVSIQISLDEKVKTWEAKYVGTCLGDDGYTKIEIEESIYHEKKAKPKVQRHFYPIGGRINESPDAQKILNLVQPTSIINFSTPENVKGLSSHFGLKLKNNGFRLSFWENSRILFVDNFIANNFLSKISISKDRLTKNKLLKYLEIDSEVKNNLRKFSIIKDLRLQRGISATTDKLFTNINYIGFEFLIEDNWLIWDNLSDGTKRLFYIISEVTLNKGLCFIEEPEIGVHPNQYRKILTFLKEQAENKQIIITTHAPKTLDILEDDELDRIILTRYDKELGTKMRHLSKEEQNHAVKFMKEESFFLSDFWTLTSFFDEEEEVV